MNPPSRAAIFIRSLLLGVVLLGLWSYAVPRAFGFRVRPNFDLAQVRTIAGLVISMIGVGFWLACLVQFAFEGSGTLVPIDAPKHLVIGGLYRYVRNPMYLAVAVALLGEAIAVADFNRDLLIYFGSLTIIVNLFVLLYEEQTLHRMFGDQYDLYRMHVRRWIPSLRAWTPPTAEHSTGSK